MHAVCVSTSHIHLCLVDTGGAGGGQDGPADVTSSSDIANINDSTTCVPPHTSGRDIRLQSSSIESSVRVRFSTVFGQMLFIATHITVTIGLFKVFDHQSMLS